MVASFNSKKKFCAAICAAYLSFLAHATIAAADDGETDKRVNHNGVVSNAPTVQSTVPPWVGWTEQVEKDSYQDKYYRRKYTADKIELRFDYISLLGAPRTDRFQINELLPDGKQKSGFADSKGNTIIPPKYDSVEQFYNDLVAVQEDKSKPWLVLDKQGNVKYTLPEGVKPDLSAKFWGVSKNGLLPVEKSVEKSDASKGAASVVGLYDLNEQSFFPIAPNATINEFSDGVCCFWTASDSKYGYVDARGKIVIPKQFEDAANFQNGLALVRLDKQWGFIDHSGKFIVTLPKNFVEVDEPQEGLAAFVVQDNNGVKTWGFIDTTGKVVLPAKYFKEPDAGYLRPKFSEGLAAAAVGDEVHRKYGFIDKQGNWKIAPQFREAWPFENGYAPVKLGPSGFNKKEWDGSPGHYILRSDQFDLFVKQFGLIGMTRTAVNKALGKPDHREANADVYTLTSSDCANAYRGAEIEYKNEKVMQHRILLFQRKEKWITTPFAVFHD